MFYITLIELHTGDEQDFDTVEELIEYVEDLDEDLDADDILNGRDFKYGVEFTVEKGW